MMGFSSSAALSATLWPPSELLCRAWVTTLLVEWVDQARVTQSYSPVWTGPALWADQPESTWSRKIGGSEVKFKRMRDMVMALSRVVGGLVMVIPVLQCLTSLTYHFGDGTYFRGTVDNTGRPAQGELYTKDQQLRWTVTALKLVKRQNPGTMALGGEDSSTGRESGERLATLTREDFFMARCVWAEKFARHEQWAYLKHNKWPTSFLT